MIGRQVGDYKVMAELGEGGMGMVYKGQHSALGQIVAVKSLHASLMNNQAAKDRFVREAQALARLNHPNIIGLKNFINDAGGCFIIMEFAEGEDLECKLQRMGLIPPSQCVPWFVEACRGLEYAHNQGCIHRDIKPSNIIVHPSGTTKLLDFGTAKLVDAQRLTQQGMTLGTVIYMSKEQLLGKPLDARSDVYSLGVTLYECVTGQLPFYDEEERKLVVKIAKEEPIPPSKHYPGISPTLEGIILKAMKKDPAQRFQNAAEMEQALMAIAGSASVAVAPAPTPTQPAQPVAAPVPVAQPQPTPAAAGGKKSVLLSPLFLIGLVLLLVGLAAGLPLTLAGSGAAKIAGMVLLGIGAVLGPVLMLVGYLQVSAGPKPAAATSSPAAAQAGGKPNCPTCGRAMLAGMAACPFCNPQAAAPPAPTPAAMPAPAAPMPVAPPPMQAPMPGAPQPMPFNPGGTLNVNSRNAAQSFGSPSTSAAAAAAPVGQAMVRIIDGNDKGKEFQITPAAAFTMGRAPTATCTLNDPGVSGVHAIIAFEGGTLFVSDNNSRNGVFVNNQKISKHPLSSGDLIVLGSTRLLVNI